MNKSDAELLPRILADAQVIDVDLSEWDRRILLVVVADHVSHWAGRLPVFAIAFVAPRDVSLEFRHAAVSADAVSGHFQWLINGGSIDDAAPGYRVQMDPSGASPRMIVTCTDIAISALAHADLDRSFPGWNAPGARLARPGIEALCGMLRRR